MLKNVKYLTRKYGATWSVLELAPLLADYKHVTAISVFLTDKDEIFNPDAR